MVSKMTRVHDAELHGCKVMGVYHRRQVGLAVAAAAAAGKAANFVPHVSFSGALLWGAGSMALMLWLDGMMMMMMMFLLVVWGQCCMPVAAGYALKSSAGVTEKKRAWLAAAACSISNYSCTCTWLWMVQGAVLLSCKPLWL
jgi:hypothetical protein